MSKFTKIRDTLESAASLAGNYFLPGSSILTDNLVSKGSQDQLNSTIGKIAQIGTGLTGSGVGSSITGIPDASSIGGGYTNLGNALGGVVGSPTLGTDIAGGLQSAGDAITGGISNVASTVGNATGLSDLLKGTGALASDAPSAADTNFLNKAAISSQGFSPAETSFLSNAQSGLGSGLGSALSGGIGGGTSSYGGLGTLASLAGGANSLYANDQAQKDLLKSQKNAMNVLQPYLASGEAANSRLSDLLGTSGNTTSAGYGTLGEPFTPSDLQNTPGYQFKLQQGQQALDRQQAAKGNYFSGAALKSAEDYGTGLADSTYNDALTQYLQQQQQQYGMLAGQGGQGQSSAKAAGDIYGNTGSAQANAGISSASILNQSLSSLLNGSGAKRLVGYSQTGQPLYA